MPFGTAAVHRVHGDGGSRYDSPLRHGAAGVLAAAGGRPDLCGPLPFKAGPGHPTDLRSDASPKWVILRWGRARHRGIWTTRDVQAFDTISPWTCTSGCPPRRRGSCTAYSCCTRDKGESLFDHSRAARSSHSTERGLRLPPSRSTRSRSRSGNSIHQFARVNPTVDALRATFGNAIGAGSIVRRHHRLRRARRLLDVMAWLRDTRSTPTTTGRRHSRRGTATRATARSVYQLRSSHAVPTCVSKRLDPRRRLTSTRSCRCAGRRLDWSVRRSTCSAYLRVHPDLRRISCGRPTPKAIRAEGLPLAGPFQPRRAVRQALAANPRRITRWKSVDWGGGRGSG